MHEEQSRTEKAGRAAPALLESFGMVVDPRREHGRDYPLEEVLLVAVIDWVLDVGLREDESRVREGHGPTNLAILRRLVVSSLRRNKTVRAGAQNKRLRAAVVPEYRQELLGELFGDAA